MGRDVLKELQSECDRLDKEFQSSCAYRTCHYRHTLISYCLRLAKRMAAELTGDGKADSSGTYKTVLDFSWTLGEMARDTDCDPHMFGVLMELEEIARRNVQCTTTA